MNKKLVFVVNSNHLDLAILDAGLISDLKSIPIEENLSDLQIQLTTIFEKHSAVDTVVFFMNNTDFTLVPMGLYEDKDQRAYLRNVVDLSLKNKLTIHADIIEEKNIVCLYTFSKDLREILESSFPSSKIKHLNSNLSSKAWPDKDEYVYASVTDGRLHLKAVKNGELLLSNSYDVQNEDEILYYSLLLYDQLGLDIASAPYYLAGDYSKFPFIKGLLQEYIQNVRILKIPSIKMSKDVNPEHSSRFYDLYLSTQCVL